MRIGLTAGILVFVIGTVLCAADPPLKQGNPDAAIANPKLKKALLAEHASISRKLRGRKDEIFMLVLTDTTWKKREPGIADAAQGAAIVVDLLALPVTALTGNAFAISRQLPPTPKGLVREDDVKLVVVQGREEAIQKVYDFTTALAFLPQDMPRYRGWTLLAKERAPEKVAAARDALLRRLQTVQPGFEIKQEIAVGENAKAAFAPAGPVQRDIFKADGGGLGEQFKQLEEFGNRVRGDIEEEAKEFNKFRNRILKGFGEE